MTSLLIFSLVALYMSFCGLLVYEGHWVIGSLLALLVISAVKVKERAR